MGKAKSCLGSESIAALGLGNLGVVMWSEITNSEATACAHFTPSGGFKNRPSWVDSSMSVSDAKIICWQDQLECSGGETSGHVVEQVRQV